MSGGTPFRSDGKSCISIARVDSREEGVRHSVEALGGLKDTVRGKSVLLKPNYNSNDPAPATTHPDTLQALINLLKDEGGAKDVTVGEFGGLEWLPTRKTMEELGAMSVIEETDSNAIFFEETVDWTRVDPPAAIHWPTGIHVPQAVLDAEAIVATPCLKTHAYKATFTLSLKLGIGYTSPENRFLLHFRDAETMQQMIAESNLVYRPSIIVMDGFDCFISGGPDKGKTVSPRLFFAGDDRVAMDAVCVAALILEGAQILGGIFEQTQIRRAIELGLGVDGPDKINLIPYPDSPSEEYAERLRKELESKG